MFQGSWLTDPSVSVQVTTRKQVKAVRIGPGHYIISGGNPAAGGNQPFNDTEFYRNGIFTRNESTTLPEPMYKACVTKINASHIFFGK